MQHWLAVIHVVQDTNPFKGIMNFISGTCQAPFALQIALALSFGKLVHLVLASSQTHENFFCHQSWIQSPQKRYRRC